MHLGMSGEFRLDGVVAVGGVLAEPGRHNHVTFEMSPAATITFNDPRRFGSMDLVAVGDVRAHRVLGRLGPEPLADEFDAAVLAKACRGKRTSLKAALMDQRVVAGLGNIYVSEALHRARLSPRRRASTIATRTGAPRAGALRLAAAVKTVLREAIDRGESYPARPSRRPRFRVYDREGERCLRKDCRGAIKRITQVGRLPLLLSRVSEIEFSLRSCPRPATPCALGRMRAGPAEQHDARCDSSVYGANPAGRGRRFSGEVEGAMKWTRQGIRRVVAVDELVAVSAFRQRIIVPMVTPAPLHHSPKPALRKSKHPRQRRNRAVSQLASR